MEGYELSQENDDIGRMNNKEAQEEANMIRVKMGQTADGFVQVLKKNEDGKLKYEGIRKSTIEDYDKALEAVEEIKRLSEEESDSEKFKNKVGRILANIDREITITWNGRFLEMANKTHAEKMKILGDAEYNLNKLKKKAKEFAIAQTDYVEWHEKTKGGL